MLGQPLATAALAGAVPPRPIGACPRCGRRPQRSLLLSSDWSPGPAPDGLRFPTRLHAASRTAVPKATPPAAAPGGKAAYGANSIQVLDGLQAVRKRPGMYIGSTGPAGLHHLVYEVVDNAIDEAQAGYATQVTVVLGKDGFCTVSDDGRGIPCELHPTTGKSALETVLTVLHAGGKFDSQSYKVSGGLHGVGVSVVNALSADLHVTVWRDGVEYTQQYQQGKPTTELQAHRPKKGEAPQPGGTTIRFLPDTTVFKGGIAFDAAVLTARLRELAYLNRGVRVTLRDERPAAPTQQDFKFDGGLKEYVRFLTEGKTPLHEPIHIAQGVAGVEVEVALLWCQAAYSETLLGFANSIRTIDGGTHLEGLKACLTKVLNAVGRESKRLAKEEYIGAEFLREGLTAIVSVKLSDPEFEGQTKTKLGNPGVKRAIDDAVFEPLRRHFLSNVDDLGRILDQAKAAARAAEAARRARDVERSKSALKNHALLSKLSDCSTLDPAEAEIFIVEGESAGGTAKQARDRRTQAVLPIRGKILNVEKTDEGRLFKSAEILTLIRALGLGIKGEAFRQKDLRYHKIVILADADVDGAHICSLLLTFFFRYNPALFTNGHIYIATPPLYKFTVGDQKHYCRTDAELEALRLRSPKGDAQRFKGLGEMNSQELYDTTMDPARRLLKRITLDDVAEAEKTVARLMGKNSEDRRDLIVDSVNHIDLAELDI